MNITEAREALSRPLLFGNEDQVHASNLVSRMGRGQSPSVVEPV